MAVLYAHLGINSNYYRVSCLGELIIVFIVFPYYTAVRTQPDPKLLQPPSPQL
jgi:hypothetical protein